MTSPIITEVRFTAVDPTEWKTGLLGFIAFTIDRALHVDGVALRRTASGRLTLSFPARVSKDGRKRSIVWPISDEARHGIESQVFEAIQFDARA